MTAPRVVPIIGTAYTDLMDCCDEAVYHVAVAPDARLALQKRIATAVYTLPRPVSVNAFYGAAVLREDAFIGQGRPRPDGHTEFFLSVVRRMWETVSHTQLVVETAELRCANCHALAALVAYGVCEDCLDDLDRQAEWAS